MSGHTLSTTEIKRDMTSETIENFPFLQHCARHFNVEESHATSLMFVTDGRAAKTFISPGTHLSDRQTG